MSDLRLGCWRWLDLPSQERPEWDLERNTVECRKGDQSSKSSDVEHDSSPERATEGALARLVSQQLLREERAGPAAEESESEECPLRDPLPVTTRRRLVDSVGRDGHDAENAVQRRHPPRKVKRDEGDRGQGPERAQDGPTEGSRKRSREITLAIGGRARSVVSGAHSPILGADPWNPAESGDCVGVP